MDPPLPEICPECGRFESEEPSEEVLLVDLLTDKSKREQPNQTEDAFGYECYENKQSGLRVFWKEMGKQSDQSAEVTSSPITDKNT